jgi:hypothetical protein
MRYEDEKEGEVTRRMEEEEEEVRWREIKGQDWKCASSSDTKAVS